MKYQLINKINPKYSIQEIILTNRGIPFNDIPHYINTTDDDINPPQKLGQDKLRAAAAVLIETIKFNERMVIIVDSDCDGFTSSALLLNYLHDLFPVWVQNNTMYLIHDGKQHGLNDHINNLIEQEKWDSKFGLVVLPDAGSNDVEECTRLKKQGIKTVVLDHHLCDVQNPDAIVINNQLSEYPNKDFSGVGVTWQFCRYIDKLLGTNHADDYLDLVALGNCADMMSMTSIETKHLINKGFKNVKNPFFFNLAQKNAYSMKNKINYTSVAFYIAPYINAICRSGTIEEKKITFQSMLKHKAFQVIPSTKRGHAKGEMETLVEQAMRVVTNVKARQTKIQDACLEKLKNMIVEKNLLNHKVLLFLLEPGEVDKNVAGLVANKFMAKYQRPVCILTKVTEKEERDLSFPEIPFGKIQKVHEVHYKTSYQGSARGCEKVGIVDFKTICAETGVTQYQTGHPNAFGLGIMSDNVQNFVEKTDAALADISDEPVYYVDYIFTESTINPEAILTIAEMQDLWGKDVQEPLIAIKGIKVTSDMVTVYQKKDNTLKITLPNGISLMKFKATDEECQKLQNQGFGYLELNVVGKCNRNQWMGNVSAQVMMQDYEIVDSNKWIF